MFETDDILSKTIEKGKEKNEWKNNEYQSRRNTCFDKTYDSKTNFHDQNRRMLCRRNLFLHEVAEHLVTQKVLFTEHLT